MIKKDDFDVDFENKPLSNDKFEEVKPLGLSVAIPLDNGQWKCADLALLSDNECKLFFKTVYPYFLDKDLEGINLDRTYRNKAFEEIVAFHTPASENKGFFVRRTK